LTCPHRSDRIKSDAIPEPLSQVLDHQRGLILRAIKGRGGTDCFSITGQVSCRLMNA